MSKTFNNKIGPEIRGTFDKKSKKGKIIKLILFLGSFLGSAVIATQYFAAQLDYNPVLLRHSLIGTFYAPYKILQWSSQYQAIYDEEIKLSFMLGFYSCFLPAVIILLIATALEGSKLKGNQFLHGSAHWADKEDICNAALLPFDLTSKEKREFKKKGKPLPKPQGVFVGAWKDPKKKKIVYLRHNGPEHVLAVAPTRSGKGVGLVNPTLLSWTESALITDIKGELWALTSGWRQQYAHNKVLKFDPATKRRCIDPENHLYSSARWNPLDEIRAEGMVEQKYNPKTKKLEEVISDGSMEVSDVTTIVNMLVDPKGEGIDKLDFWGQTARQLLIAAIIHLKHNLPPDQCNLYNVYMMLSGQINTEAIRNGKPNTQIEVKNLYADMKLGLDRNGKEYSASEVVKAEGNEMYNAPEEQGGSTLSTAKSFIQTYSEAIVAENTSCSDFKIRQIMNSEQPVSLYLVVSPAKKDDMRPLLRLLMTLMVSLNCDDMKFEGGRSIKSYAHKMLLMLDEFPSWGQLDKIKEGIAYMAGYGLKCYLITQDMAQLQAIYGENESISSNCHIQIFYAPLNAKTADIMSKKIGTTTIVKESVSVSGGGLKTSKSKSIQETSRPLLTADECMQLPSPKKDAQGNILAPGDMIIIVAGFPAIYGVQPLYFKDPALLARAQVPPPEASDVLTFPETGIRVSELLAPEPKGAVA